MKDSAYYASRRQFLRTVAASGAIAASDLAWWKGPYLWPRKAHAAATVAKFPAKPIELVVPWSPGGGSDRAARALAGTWGVYSDVPLRILNRAAGGGREGHQYGAKAAPDGHTLTISAINVLTMPAYGDVGFDLESFIPLFNIVKLSYWVIGRKDAPYNDMKEFIAYLKANPGKLSYNSSGTGSDQHIGTETFLNKLGGLEMTQKHVPLEGGAEQVAMILGGHNDFALGTYGTWTPTVKAGKVKVLAVTDVARNPDTPDVPTLRELGIDWDFISFRCMLAPAGTPQDRIETLEALFKKVMDDKGFQQTMSKFGEPLYWQNSKDLTAKLYKMRADMLPVVKKMKAAESK